MWDLWQFQHRAWKRRLRQDRAEIATATEAIRPGDVVVDVGAHKGAYLYWLRRAVGDEGQAIAFEPQPRLAAYLRRMSRLSGWDNVAIENLALSDRAGTLPLHLPTTAGKTSPGARLGRKHAEDQGRVNSTIDVPVVTLDEYLAGRGIGRVDFLKCDAEGHELSVFRGAERTLRESRPTLLFECEGRLREDGDVRPVFDYLQELGYVGAYLDAATGQPLSLELFDPESHQPRDAVDAYKRPGYCNNFVFRPAFRAATRVATRRAA